MMMDPQQQAIETLDRNLAVTAGAGSGKTYVLVERFLALLRANPAWRLNQVVAITFTRAAAMEMRERVRQRLVQMSASAAEEATRSHARRLIEQMDSARIDTIHGLCASLLRANAAEAGLDPDFTILEEVDATLLANRALDQWLRSAIRAGWPPALVIAQHIPRSEEIVTALRKMLPYAARLTLQSPHELLQSWAALRETRFAALLQSFISQAQVLLGDLARPAKADDKLALILEDVEQRLSYLAEFDADAQLAQLDAIASINLHTGSAKAWGKAELAAARNALKTVRTRCRNILANCPPLSEVDAQAAELNAAWVELIQRAQQAYETAKMEQRALDFNDLEERAARLLDEHPAVRERYRTQEFRQILVDEFQDTNEAQWRIIEHLSGVEREGSLFIVGDPKQSIYGFRGADVRVFERVQRLIQAQPSGLSVKLTRSWRSHPGLVDSFNHLFERILRRDPQSSAAEYQIEYGAAMQAVREDVPAQPSIELILLRKSKTADPGVAAPNEAARRHWEAHVIAQHILRLQRESFLVHERSATGETLHRPFHFGDAVLLFQSMSDVVVYEEAFKALNIPYITIAGKGFYHRQEIRDALNLLRALHNPADNLALAAALRSPFFAFSDEMLLALRLPLDDARHPETLWQALQMRNLIALPARFSAEEIARITHARQTLAELRRIAGRLTIGEVLRRALAMTGYLASITALPAGQRRRRNVEKLLDVADSSRSVMLGAFNDYIAELNEREVREGEATLESQQAVRLMTVHASKGLEFPVVYLANAAWQRSASSETLTFEESLGLIASVPGAASKPFLVIHAQDIQRGREDAESRRKLYVAMTRARDLLVICAAHGTSRTNNDRTETNRLTWKDLLLDALDIEDAQDQQQRSLGTGKLQIHMPRYSEMIMRTQTQQAQIMTGDEATIDPAAPPLLAPLSASADRLFKHISATQLAQIGEAQYRQLRLPYVALLDDEESVAAPIPRVRMKAVTRRLVGEIVHEAIRYWRFPQNFDGLAKMLQAHAWSQHLTSRDLLAAAAAQAEDLLRQFQRSELYTEIEAARRAGRPVLREVPFILRSDERLIHGIVDVLFQDASGAWVIADYKTSHVPYEKNTPQRTALAQHAKRYYFQVGAYATAVEAQFGAAPRVLLHYIRYNQTLTIDEAQWRGALLGLRNTVREMIQGEEDASLA